MIEKICAWIYRKGRRSHHNQCANEAAAVMKARNGPSFSDGLTFQLYGAENGKILQVIDQQQLQNHHMVGPSQSTGVKTYIIAPDEDVIEAITRALVSERIK